MMMMMMMVMMPTMIDPYLYRMSAKSERFELAVADSDPKLSKPVIEIVAAVEAFSDSSHWQS